MLASSMGWPELLALGTLAALLIGSRFLPAARMSVAIRRERRRRHHAADVTLAASYHRQLPPEVRAESLDDRTFRDLDLDELFRSLDFTASQPGRQYLYHMLRTPQQQREPLERLERAGRELAGVPHVLDTLRAHLGRLDDPRAGQLAHLVLGELPKRPRFWWTFPLLTAGALTCLALIPFWPRALVAWLVIAVVNVCVQLFYKPKVKRFVPALHELPRLLSVAGALGTLKLQELEPEITRLGTGSRDLGSLRRATSWLMFEPDEASEFVGSVYEYVNLLFLLDVNAFVFAVDRMRACQAQVRVLFEAIGYLDVVQSIAAWRATLPVWCTPQFTEARKHLAVDGLVHPLV
ncbi:MAG TPA: hypothetical protein VFT96_01610, partial [Gemmatimonadaceae bacterium]|nr:hypothetical protein [Gemmatimonadaceae bacterium]